MEINRNVKGKSPKQLLPAKEPKIKMGNISPTILQNIYQDFSPNNPLNHLLTVDNQAYYAIFKSVSDKAYVKIPYYINSDVFHCEPRLQKDISRIVLKLTPYNLIDGMCISSVKMYDAKGLKGAYNAHYRVLSQSYILRTALCVGVSSNGTSKIITSNPIILSSIPTPCDISTISQRLDLRNDDLHNGVLSCVQLIPSPCGYDIKPDSVSANTNDFVILPKFCVDYFINYIHSLLNSMCCTVKYATPDGKEKTVTACNRPPKDNFMCSVSARYLEKEPCKYGIIRCIDINTGRVVAFPLTHLISVCKA